MAKKTDVTPTYMTGSGKLRIGLHDVSRIMKMLDQKGQTRRFQNAAKGKEAYVEVGKHAVNFVKDYIVDNKLHNHPIGKHIVNAQGIRSDDDPYDCNFGSGTAGR